jgi:hypothetical protein
MLPNNHAIACVLISNEKLVVATCDKHNTGRVHIGSSYIPLGIARIMTSSAASLLAHIWRFLVSTRYYSTSKVVE